MRPALLAVVLAVSAAVTALSIVLLPHLDVKDPGNWRIIAFTAALWALFALAIWLLRSVRGRAAVVLVLVGSVAIGGAALAGPPNTSTDSARYAWDGIVQNAGISPYDYVPADPALADLRPEWLFPTPERNADGKLVCTGSRIMTFEEVGTGDTLCSAINRAPSPTIYPPLSELLFVGVRALVGPEATYWPIQVLGLVVSLAITALLLRTLHRTGRDPRWAALWGWCPLVATEAITNSHIDMVGALLLVLATIAVAGGRRLAGGVALGAAIATKLIPVIGAPALLRRQPVRVIVAAVATFAVLYVPYVLASGIQVLGYLPGYLSEEGYESGARFILFSPFFPGASSLVIVALLLLAVGVVVWRLTDPSDPWLGQLVMIGVTLALVTPRYPWYALLLVPMVAMTGRWEWLAVPLALTARYLIPSTPLARLMMLAAIVFVVVMTLRRAEPPTRRLWSALARHPIRTLRFPERGVTKT